LSRAGEALLFTGSSLSTEAKPVPPTGDAAFQDTGCGCGRLEG